jgi:hypothetical protein
VDKFIVLVKEMRRSQKRYFAARSPRLLNEAKQWEKAVDEWIDQQTKTEDSQEEFKFHSGERKKAKL